MLFGKFLFTKQGRFSEKYVAFAGRHADNLYIRGYAYILNKGNFRRTIPFWYVRNI